jgi:hypothetical protein
MRQDTQTFTYKLTNPATTCMTMSFSWDTPWHMLFDGAEVIV